MKPAREKVSRRNFLASIPRLSRALGPLSGIAVLACTALGVALPAGAIERTYHTDADIDQVCGSASPGTTGILTDAVEYTCADDVITVAGESDVGLWIASTPYASDTWITGGLAYVDTTASGSGTLSYELGYYTESEGHFTPFGRVDRDSNVGELQCVIPIIGGGFANRCKVDFSDISAMVPAGGSLALRVRNPDGNFSGSFRLGNTNDPEGTVRITVTEGAVHRVPSEYATIQDGINDSGDDDVVLVADGTYSGPGFTNVNFNGILARVISENGPEHTVIDCRYNGWGFLFENAESSRAGLEGLTIVRASYGAVRIVGGSSPAIRNCVFRNNENEIASLGGAIHIFSSSSTEPVVVQGCTFTNNYGMYGGGVGIDVGMADVSDSLFIRNSSRLGGGIFIGDVSTVNVEGSTFIENTAELGGGLSSSEPSESTVYHSTFRGNLAKEGGGIFSKDLTIANSVFTDNRATTRGGAIAVQGPMDSKYTVVVHSTLLDNEGGGISVDGGSGISALYLWNSILWSNGNLQITRSGSGTVIVSGGNSIVEGGREGGIAGEIFLSLTEIIDEDPLVALPGSPHLMPGSPGIDGGVLNPALPDGTPWLPKTDRDGVPLALSACGKGTPDIGAFEYHGDCGIPVPAVSPSFALLTARAGGAPPDPLTLSIRNAAETPLDWSVQENVEWLEARPPIAGDSTEEVDTVSLFVNSSGLAPGEYRGTVTVHAPDAGYSDSPREIEVILRITTEHVASLSPGPGEYGTIQEAIDDTSEGDEVIVADGTYTGAGNTDIRLRSRRVVLRSKNGPAGTVIDCGGAVPGFFVPIGAQGTVLQGFTVQNCIRARGAGLYTDQLSSVSILDFRFLDNQVTGGFPTRGGGAYIGGSAYLSNCEFDSNDADYGGGLYFENSNDSEILVVDSTFTNNSATEGGGVYFDPSLTSPATVRGSLFRYNGTKTGRTCNYGGGAYLTGWYSSIQNSTFENNSVAQYGGGIYNDFNSRSSITNSVLATNSASRGGGIYLYHWSSGTEVTNCTLRGNSASVYGGGIYKNSDATQVLNCIVVDNNAVSLGDDIYPVNKLGVTYSLVGMSGDPVEWNVGGRNNYYYQDPQFRSTSDLRITPDSIAVDRGKTVNWLFSDYRGSYRAVDGDVEPFDSPAAKFDIGAYEYSRYYGGIEEDETAKAFRDLTINGSIVATGYEYRIEWRGKDPFPYLDERVQQAGDYEARLLLVNEYGQRLELGTWVLQLGQGYSVPYTFGAEHIGTWRIRLEIASDPNQFILSEPFEIQYKDLQTFYLGRAITPPPGALQGQQPDVDFPEAVYWSSETNRFYAIAPYPIQITWYEDAERTVPILVLAMLSTPPDPEFHVTDSPPVDLLPGETLFDSVEVMWSESSASISANSFTAVQEGWTVLLFRDPQNPDPDKREYFTVVQSLAWNHDGTQPVADGTLGETPPLDPIFPVEKPATIGTKITDDEHDGAPEEGDCGGGHVFFEVAPYDGAGDNRAYDRPTRQGPIFSVNEDDPRTEDDDLVVVWYRHQMETGVCWPFKPVRYDPQWPAGTTACPGDPPGNCDLIEIAGKLVGEVRIPSGSGALPPDVFGSLETMLIYSQPSRRLPGFNPNEEHAAFFASQGTPYPGVFPLRSDLNYTEPDQDNFTSKPWALLKYRDPLQAGEWNFKVFRVDPGTLTYISEAGNEFNPPYPLNQFVYGPCRDDGDTPRYEGSYTEAPPTDVLTDKDGKLFSIRGEISVVNRYFYRLQPEFHFDPDGNGYPDAAAGTCIPWLDGWNAATEQYEPLDGTPAAVTHDIVWPETPTLYVGETLLDAKTQAGETVGLPNVKDQCIVQVLHDEAGLRLFDPIKEYSTDFTLPPGVETSPSPAVGTKVYFVDLPFHLQSRLTYDDVEGKLRIKGRYITDTGEPTLLLNRLTERERQYIQDTMEEKYPGSGAAFYSATGILNGLWDGDFNGTTELKAAEMKALSAGDASDASVLHWNPATESYEYHTDTNVYVTLAFNNDADGDCAAPTMLSVIKVGCPLYEGEIKVIESTNVFEEKLTLRHNGDFGGKSDDRHFQWLYLQNHSGVPLGPGTPGESWLPFDPANSDPQPLPGTVSADGGTFYRGFVDITPLGTGQQLLPDRWFSTRYHYDTGGACGVVSPWTKPQLAEGWVKRVMKKVNLFDQKVKDFHMTDTDTVASMISQAGRAYEGDVALSDDPDYLKGLGLIELYETLMRRALALSLDASPPDASLRDAVLFAVNRLTSLYMLLGNEAYADSADPMIGFSTEDGIYGAHASSIFSFQNQMDSLLEEELALLRGRDEAGVRPFYNRLIWNFTIADGEVAYRQVYNITDVADNYGGREPDGEINEFDAKFLFPQGHGDAWGYYLLALKRFYYLITHDAALWNPTAEGILVAQTPVEVDYRDERAFATAAAARARAGADIVGLTYRQFYDEDPENQWQGYPDSNPARGWGLDEWAVRAGQGAYIDWAVGNALMPPVDDVNEGIKKVDRTTVVELFEIPGHFDAIQGILDQADGGLNPLGIAKDTIPFDIDPSLVDEGSTHFEQILDRALQALNNTVTVYNFASQDSQLLRRQQDHLDDFQRTIAEREADFTNRLVEVFGYPYSDDCGPNKLYSTEYCETGPDIYHYMYLEPSELTGMKTVIPYSFSVTFRELEVDDAGGLVTNEKPVTFTVDTDRRFGIVKPRSWRGSRRSVGSLQLARADLLQLRGRFEQALIEYDNLIGQIEDQAWLIQQQYALNASEIKILQEGKSEQASLNDAILSARANQESYRSAAQNTLTVANAAMEALPKVLGIGLTAVTDPLSVVRGIVLTGAQVASYLLNQEADSAQAAEMSSHQSKEITSAETNIRLVTERGEFAVQQQLMSLETLVRDEAVKRKEIYTLIEGLHQSAARYLSGLTAGERILEERLRFRKQTAAQIQQYRYTDMAFRVFRNDALQKYKSQLDMAARYIYLAAKAYDYDTTLLDSSSKAGRAFLTGIVKERSIGTVLDDEPLTGTGLADSLRRLSLNFQVLKPQLGFNNPQQETNRFSLRQELFRIQPLATSADTWRDTLISHKVADLWSVPEFRRYCRPFAPEGVPQPGLVIPFRTTVTSGLNFFGWPLGGGDSYYSAANFATKVRSVGVWFSNYNAVGLAQTPRVYLVPTGEDVLRSPTLGIGDIRTWHVLDQKIPEPFPFNATEMAGDINWIPSVNTVFDDMGQVRRHSDFKAYHDSGYLDSSEMTYDTRLIGRSVWNSRWMLIIPGRNLLYDPDEGLDTFINGPEVIGGAGERTGYGISDIRLFFETYAYSGN